MPESIISFDCGNATMILHGFINVDIAIANKDAITFGDIYDSIKDEIYDIYGFTNSDYLNNKFKIILCYESLYISRLMIYSYKPTKESISTKKNKKIKFWRNKS
jgi:hypothetical protein